MLEASSGEEALRLYRSRDDIVLLVTDIRMPGMDGIVLAERLIKGTPNAPVIYVTGYCQAAPHALPRSVWMRKPLSMDEFLSHVRELLMLTK